MVANIKISVFSSDYTDARLIKRMRAFVGIGCETLCVSFQRQRYNRDYVPEWNNIHLGVIQDRKYLQRIPVLSRAAGRLLKARRVIGASQVFYAINLDQLLLAVFMKYICGGKVLITYEVADIQHPLVRKDLFGSLLRGLERCLLRSVDLLVVTSPGYIRNYFVPIQRYQGLWFLLENKVYPAPADALRTVLSVNEQRHHAEDHVWVVGFFGALKCKKSWEIIKHIARALPHKVVFRLAGYPTRIDQDDFFNTIAELENIIYLGEYKNPDELGKIYGGVDLVWCFDFSNGEYNSVWCLANRIYEGGYFEIPLLASKNYESGNFVERHGIGWTFSEPYADALLRFLEELTVEKYMQVKRKYQSIDKTGFSGDQQHQEMCDRMMAIYQTLWDR